LVDLTRPGVAVKLGLDPRKLARVARFELAEALRSRLISVVFALYGVGAALGAYIFSKTLDAAEAAVREQMFGTLSAHSVPDDIVRQQALPRVISFLVDDAELARELSSVDPLALFYGFMALELVAPLVLMTSGGLHSGDIATGAARFVLTRCDRLTWALGKWLGHAVLLAVGLLVGALATAIVAGVRSGIDAGSVLWLLRASFRAWVYGLAYLGLFSWVALAVRSPSRVRTLSILLLFALWMGHSICNGGYFAERLPALRHLVWLFPAHYQLALWSPNWLASVPAILALLAIGLGALGLGHAVFRRADA
jgi:ABC-type transport system involved in multi-copper enzyme maturation permease subunit